MKYLKLKGISIWIISAAVAIIIIMISCKKGVNHNKPGKFDATAAKEWYYGTFKKSVEWKNYDSKRLGVKSPDWKHGVYRKTADMEMVEFPLIKTKSRLFIPTSPEKLIHESTRIAEAVLTRVVIIKKGANIVVREVNYVPDMDYLFQHKFDISHNNIGTLDNDFSGRLIVKKWNETEVSRYLVDKGKISRKGKLQKIISMPKQTAAESQSCSTYQICEYERECEYVWQGDMLMKECGAWSTTGLCWYEQYCEIEEDLCGGLNEDACECVFWGNCGDNPEPPKPCAAEQEIANAGETSEKEDIEIINETGNTRTKRYRWKVFTVSDGAIPMFLRSIEYGYQTKAGYWKFKSFEHHKIENVGQQILYGVSVENEKATTTLTSHLGRPDQVANISLSFSVRISIVCDGLPTVSSKSATPKNQWHVSE